MNCWKVKVEDNTVLVTRWDKLIHISWRHDATYVVHMYFASSVLYLRCIHVSIKTFRNNKNCVCTNFAIKMRAVIESLSSLFAVDLSPKTVKIKHRVYSLQTIATQTRVGRSQNLIIIFLLRLDHTTTPAFCRETMTRVLGPAPDKLQLFHSIGEVCWEKSLVAQIGRRDTYWWLTLHRKSLLLQIIFLVNAIVPTSYMRCAHYFWNPEPQIWGNKNNCFCVSLRGQQNWKWLGWRH